MARKQATHRLVYATQLGLMQAMHTTRLAYYLTFHVQDVAERLAREARILRFQPRCIPMDAYDVTQLPQEQLAVFVASTTGQVSPHLMLGVHACGAAGGQV
jgi:sulfite reductase alpha subunit-like flavoprotein